MEDFFSKFQKAKIRTDEDLFLTGKIFLLAYKKLKNKNRAKTQEDLLTSMVKEKRLVQVDELKILTNTSDPNYYSPLTNKSAFSYAVEYKNIDFALLLLNKMKGEYENEKGEYFQRKALTIEESFTQRGSRLKNGKVNTGNTYPFSNYDYEISKVKEKYDNQIEELENKKKKDIAKMKKGKEADKMSDIVEKELEKINRIYKNFEQNVAKTYENDRHHIQILMTLNNVSRILFDKWSKKFNTDKR